MQTYKFPMKRILNSLTFENVIYLCQIMAKLNYRPLLPFYADRSDYDVLTPSYRLIGRIFTALADLDIRNVIWQLTLSFPTYSKIVQVFSELMGKGIFGFSPAAS